MITRRGGKSRIGPAGLRKPDSAARGAPADPQIKAIRLDATEKNPVAPKVVHDPGQVRLSKLMSERGLCSRREADALIERGLVFVDGERVTQLGTRINPSQIITLDKRAERQQSQRVTILLHKPVGYVSSQPEKGYQAAVTLIGKESRYQEDRAPQPYSPEHLHGLAPAGRLDIDSTGLLVLTQDGRIAKQLIGADSEIEKEYLVRVEGRLSEANLNRLCHGLSLDGEALKPAKVSWQNQDQLRFILKEGKKRQIRRMCELVGLKVVGLKRIRIGKVKLGDLPAGQWRYLLDSEQF
ncbi:MAG: rRNA pseudouridine synthase [Betaproteobacteria bacterium]|nr:rRNA pseudouridine synthase [Betaproteobacteria bacterium]